MVPIGGIIQWSGAIIDIPANFHLCNGLDGTPDLTDRFIMGAGSTWDVDEVGGESSHDHVALNLDTAPFAPGFDAWSGQDSGITDTLPPWYALANIIRIS